MNRINWTAVAVFAIVALLVFLIGASLLGGWGYGGWGMMGGYRSGMMGRWGFGPFGWIGMIAFLHTNDSLASHSLHISLLPSRQYKKSDRHLPVDWR